MATRGQLASLTSLDGHKGVAYLSNLTRWPLGAAYLFEGSLGQQVTFDTRQSLVGIVVGLLDQAQLLPLRLVQPTLDTVKSNQYHVNKNSLFFLKKTNQVILCGPGVVLVW